MITSIGSQDPERLLPPAVPVGRDSTAGVAVMAHLRRQTGALLEASGRVGDDDIGEDEMERQLITGIAHDKNEAKVTLTSVPDRPGAVANIFGPLADANINVDMIIQNIAKDKGETDVTFTVPAADLARTQALRRSLGLNRPISPKKSPGFR